MSLVVDIAKCDTLVGNPLDNSDLGDATLVKHDQVYRDFDATDAIGFVTGARRGAIADKPVIEEVLRTLGKGAQGCVELVRRDVREYARKRALEFGALNQEITILSLLTKRDAHVMVPEFIENQSIYFEVMHRSLAEAVRGNNADPITSERLNDITYQLASGLKYLKEAGVVHFDLKPENILEKLGILKITDFGIALIAGETASRNKGTPKYMPPEVIPQEIIADASADIYSLGVLLFNIITGNQYPFENTNDFALIFHKGTKAQMNQYDAISPRELMLDMLKNKATFPIIDAADPHFRIIEDCISNPPNQRPTAEDIMARVDDLQLNSFENLEITNE